jgi:uncharacterized membrane protein
MNTAPSQPLPAPLYFDAVLTPHCSLGRKGFVILMSVIIAVNFIAGMVFLLKGAWPVFGFCGLDVALVYWAFKANYRAAAAHETVQLSDSELRIRRVDAKGKVSAWSFQPHWARLVPEHHPDESVTIRLTSHGSSLELAHCLSVPERLDFATALNLALARVRQPLFAQ